MEDETKKSIHEAVCSGEVVQVHIILREDPSSVNDHNQNFANPLQLGYVHVDTAIPTPADDRLPILQLLIDYGADVNKRGIGAWYGSPLHLAVRKNQINGVKVLLKHKADPNLLDVEHHTALGNAVLCGRDSEFIKLLLDYNANPNIVIYGAKCAVVYKSLFQSCKSGQQELIDFVLRHASEMDSHRHFSFKALISYTMTEPHHFKKGICTILKLLHKQGININDDSGDSDLHVAVCQKDETKINNLLEKGEYVNVQNFFGDTPLHL
ncbi:ankyrin-2-like [Copidosoma floridanum]|uniref:ankyrin-2-like n=1 Tax=Copidosoma floridanum TaxID=29053 RepID=UPI0006C9DE9D|nr:ankyrin-2-like [Copidosoma floridanum]